MRSFSESILAAIAEELEAGAIDVRLEDRLDEDLGLDSLALVSIIARVEEATGQSWSSVYEFLSEDARVADLVALRPEGAS